MNANNNQCSEYMGLPLLFFQPISFDSGAESSDMCYSQYLAGKIWITFDASHAAHGVSWVYKHVSSMKASTTVVEPVYEGWSAITLFGCNRGSTDEGNIEGPTSLSLQHFLHNCTLSQKCADFSIAVLVTCHELDVCWNTDSFLRTQWYFKIVTSHSSA